MANVLSKSKHQQVLALGRLGWTLRRIEEEVGVRRETAGRYLRAAGIEIREPGRWGHGQPSKAAIEVSTDSAAGFPPIRPGRSPSVSASEPYRDLIEAAVRVGRDAMSTWQDLVDDHGFQHGYASVRRFVSQLRLDSVSTEAHPVIVTGPGEEAQVDYGTGPMVRPSPGAKHKRTRLFVLTLGYSRKAVRLLTFQSSSQIWSQLHETSFRRLGGAARTVVLDNLREGVLTPDVHDPGLNPVYRDMLAHYGVVALPCRVRHPDRKGKVESGVAHAQRKLAGLRFDSLEQAQAYLDRWEDRWADTRIHGTTKQQVSAMFEAERPHLLALPVEPFRYYRHGRRTVHLDGYVEVERAYYAPPPGYIGQDLLVQWDDLHVRILNPKNHVLLREHLRQRPGGRRMMAHDQPRRTSPGIEALLLRAAGVGVKVGQLCRAAFERDRETAVRRIQGVLTLARKHGAAATDDACAAALELGISEYRFVRRYLERQRPESVVLKQIDPLIRELTKYRDYVNVVTEQGEQP
ncbi:MAG TPA: IS21 family transposase [Candidatus Binatia bacterium]|nr:IS21 family transposase [Candidatus Binatia bacterium]